MLPDLLGTEAKPLVQFAGGFCWGKFQTRGWPWVDDFATSQWSPEQIGQFFSFLPFTLETWERSRILREDQSAYWRKPT